MPRDESPIVCREFWTDSIRGVTHNLWADERLDDVKQLWIGKQLKKCGPGMYTAKQLLKDYWGLIGDLRQSGVKSLCPEVGVELTTCGEL